MTNRPFKKGVMNANQIITEIINYLNIKRISIENCYVGITNNVERRLFEEHCVNKNSYGWIYRVSSNEEEVRIIEKYFLSLGMKGDSGGGTENCNTVYVYLITNDTIQKT